jgi:hypothetical protein
MYQDDIDGTCGVGFVCYFEDDKWSDLDHTEEVTVGGAGLFVAGYIDTPRCREVFEEYKGRYKMLLRTTPRMNKNSGNMFSFVVYDRNWPNFTPEMNEKKVWPF